MSAFIVPGADNAVNPVVRAAANLPTATGTSTATIYTVAGGNILLKGLVVEITTAVTSGSSTGTITLRPKSTPSVGSPTNLSAVSATLTAAAVPIGSMLSLTGDVTVAFSSNVATQGALAAATIDLVIRPGSLQITFVNAVENLTAGAYKCYLVYELLDAGASVVAA